MRKLPSPVQPHDIFSAPQAPVLSSEIVKASRLLLGWSQETLSFKAGISVATVKRLESGTTAVSRDVTLRVVRAFSSAGVESVQYGMENGQYTRIQMFKPRENLPPAPPRRYARVRRKAN